MKIFCRTVTSSQLIALGVFATALHPRLERIHMDMACMRILFEACSDMAQYHVYMGLEVLRVGMRDVLGLDVAQDSRTHFLYSDPAWSAAMRVVFAYAVLRFQGRLRSAPELYSACARVFVSGAFARSLFTQPKKALIVCRSLITFVGISMHQWLMLADPDVLAPKMTGPALEAVLDEQWEYYIRGPGDTFPEGHERLLRLSQDLDASICSRLRERVPMDIVNNNDDGAPGPYELLLRSEVIAYRNAMLLTAITATKEIKKGTGRSSSGPSAK